MPFPRRHPKVDCNRLWRSRSPVSCDRSYLLHDPRNRSREPSPVSRDRSYALHDPRKRSREPSPVSSESSYALHDPRNRSREPSPVSSESSYALHDPRSRSREPSLASIESSFVLHDTRRRSRERSPVRFARGSRTEHRRAAVQMYNEYRRPSGQHVCSQFRSDTFPGYGAFLSYGERRYSSTRDRNEFVHRQYNCMAAGTEWKRRRDWNGKIESPPRRNPNFRETDIFSSPNTVDNSNAPLSPVICSYYNSMKTCKKGDSCKFIHLCRYFIENNCKFKQLCKRSHNIFDWQPKHLLQRYDLIPNDNFLMRFNELDIITSVKEELRKVKSIPSETTPPTLNRPLLDEESYLERAKLSPADTDTPSICEREGGSTCEPITSPELDWSEVNQSDNAEEQGEKTEDFIPLETKSKIEKNDKKDKSKKRKKRKSDKKASKETLKGDAIKLEPVEENLSDADDTDVDLSITFEYNHPERRFLVRQIKNKWKISNIDGEWKELSSVESEVFNRLSDKGLETADKALSKY